MLQSQHHMNGKRGDNPPKLPPRDNVYPNNMKVCLQKSNKKWEFIILTFDNLFADGTWRIQRWESS